MSNALRELLAFFKIEVDSAPLKQADKEIDGFKGTLKTVGTAIATYFAVDQIREFLGASIELGASISDTAERLGVGTEELQQFQYAVTLTGGSTEAANDALLHFSKNIGDATTGNQAATDAFNALHVSVRGANGEVGDTMDLLEGVADGFSQLKTDGERTMIAMQLFGRGGKTLIPLLKQGSAGVKQLRDEFKSLGGGLSKDTLGALADADDALDRMSFTSKLLKAELVAGLAPALTTVIGWVTGLVATFRELADNSYIAQTAMYTLGVAAAVAAVIWGLLNIEILLVVAGIALLVLAVDDLYTWLEGGDSVIGRFFDSLLGEGTSDQFLKDVKQDYDDLKKAADDLKPVTDALWDAMVIGAKAAGKFIEQSVKGLIRLAQMAGLLSKDKSFYRDQDNADIAARAQEERDRKAWVKPGGPTFGDTLRSAAHWLGAKDAFPTVQASRLAAGGGTNIQQGVGQHNEISITVHGANDPDEVAKKTGDAVGDKLLDLREVYAGAPGGG